MNCGVVYKMLNNTNVIEQLEFSSMFEFFNYYNLIEQVKSDYKINDIDELISKNLISSDQDCIEEYLIKMNGIYSIEFINNNHDGYWTITEYDIKPYSKDDLQIDIDWLNGFNIPVNEAESFIKSLLNKQLIEE